jgi:phosphoesterase RecJ-like protein
MPEQIIAILHEHERFGITTHIGPEADAIGSQLGMVHILRALGKKTWAVLRDPVPDTLKFLPGWETIKHIGEIPQDQIEVWVVVDCGQLSRVGEGIYQLVQDHPMIVNIDHHQDNPRFGHVNWVRVTSSTTMLIFELAKQIGIEVTPELATCLYAGIVADTDSFRNANVTPQTLLLAAELLDHGARSREISINLYERRSLPELRLLGYALQSAHVEDGVIWSSIPGDLFQQTGGSLDDTERLAEELRAAGGIHVAVLFKELPNGKIKVSLRSKNGVDVSRVARIFGGGGHPQAAGCLIPGDLPDVEARVLSEVRHLLEAGRPRG